MLGLNCNFKDPHPVDHGSPPYLEYWGKREIELFCSSMDMKIIYKNYDKWGC